MYINRLNERYKRQAAAYRDHSYTGGGWVSSSTDWESARQAGEVEVVRGN